VLFDIVNIHPLRRERKQETCMEAKDNALNFVGQIMKAYNAAEKARGTALKHAIECGEYLNLAKENVIAAKGKGKWKSWLKENCPEVHLTTAELYMRLARNTDKIEDCKSILDADLKLRQPSNGNAGSPNTTPEAADADADDGEGDDNSQRVVTTRQGASPDLTATFQNVAVDEVCAALTQAWDPDQLQELIKRVNAYLVSLGPTPTTARRPLPQPTL
jgi:hypothetical protein